MSHYTVLWFLARRGSPEGVPMGAVIDGQLNRASDATRLADRLTALGMIERLASESDRRVVLVRLTDEGREAYSRLTREIQALHRRQWSGLSPGELEQLRRLLAKVLGESHEKLVKLSAAASD
jgi:DNA-binding MarR family transcriptional regulator